MRQRTTGSHTSEPTPERSASPPDCDMVTVPARQGLEAVDLLRLSPGGVGPVLHDRTGDSLAFLVPPGTADCWDVPGSACTRRGGEPRTPHAGWLVPPHTDTAVTDPAVLRAALGAAARTLELADALGPDAAEEDGGTDPASGQAVPGQGASGQGASGQAVPEQAVPEGAVAGQAVPGQGAAPPAGAGVGR